MKCFPHSFPVSVWHLHLREPEKGRRLSGSRGCFGRNPQNSLREPEGMHGISVSRGVFRTMQQDTTREPDKYTRLSVSRVFSGVVEDALGCPNTSGLGKEEILALSEPE